MAAMSKNVGSDRPVRPGQVQVWDLPTRLFHWLLVGLVAAGAVTGYFAPEWWLGSHVWAGYGIAVLIVFRLIWAMFGSEYSRVVTFAFSPGEVARHLRGVLMFRPPHYIGHNPTGALMIFALVIVLVGITATGILALGGVEKQGPWAGVTSFTTGDAANVVHWYLSDAMMIMIAVHVVGVIVESLLVRENLVRAMIEGKKRLPEGVEQPEPREAHTRAATLTIGAVVLVAGVALMALDRLPPTGVLAPPVHEVFRTECGECHQVYHPSLLPAAAWQGMMRTLDDHFGEDASLDEEVARSIGPYLTAYASEAWDTEAANRFRSVSAAAPWQISATPDWVRTHRGISKDVFARKGVGSISNCVACHRDADTGRYDDQMITIPEEKRS